MRLLEFTKDEGGANPQRSKARSRKHEPTAPITHASPSDQSIPSTTVPDPNSRSEAHPIQGTAIRKLVRRVPIDLEQLQQRIGFLERRLQDQPSKTEKLTTVRDLNMLRERMNRLENSLEQELVAARSRESRLLKALDKPPLKILLRTRAIRFWREDLPVIGAWLTRIAHRWWQEVQPEWWPQLASAWKESLEKARR